MTKKAVSRNLKLKMLEKFYQWLKKQKYASHVDINVLKRMGLESSKL